MSYIQAYNISLFNDVPYPNEQYKSAVNVDYFNLTNRDFLFTNILRYQKRPSNEILDFLNVDILNPKNTSAILYYDATTSNTYLSSNANFKTNSNIFYAEDLNTIQLNAYSTSYFNISALRQKYKTPQEFQVFYIQNDPNINDCYGYLLYPNRLFLNPTTLKKDINTGYWNLSTTTKIMAWSAIFVSSNSFEKDAYPIHKNYVSNVPQLCSLSNLLDATYTLNYSVCASRTRMGVQVLPSNFSSNYNPAVYATQFETDTVKVNPDSTFISYSASFINPNGNKVIISQQHPYSYLAAASYTFTTSYITNYDPTVNTIQEYQLIQYPSTPSLPLGAESNAILKCKLDLSNSKFTFDNSSNAATGVSNSNIYFDYIADALNINGSPAIGTFNSIKIGSTPYTINSDVLATTVSNNTMSWVSTYPPHYYTYKTRLNTSDGNYLDSFNLNFYLKTSALNTAATDGVSYALNLQLSSFIVSDYNALVYDLYNNTKTNEQIKYTITNINNYTALNSVSAYYGPSNTYYDLKNPAWIPATTGSYLNIVYSPLYGEIDFAIRASLKGDFGILDAFEETSAVLARQHTETNNGTTLFLDILKEESNLIIVDSSFNTNAIAWPSRDLTNSKISWSVSPYASYVQLYSVNTDTKKFIRYITNGEELDFDPTTETLAVSGYGPQQTTISLSSQKYNEIASVTTNTSLFDYFGEGVFSVTPVGQLNNLERVRSIDLKLQVPYQGRLYDIPQFLNTPIYWTWTYDDNIDPLTQPISAYEPLNNNIFYNYAASTNYALVSTIRIKVLPDIDIKPIIHSVTVTANSDVRVPAVTGSFTFNVDAFPDKTTLNSDFKTYYKNYSSIEIGDTFNGLNTITRAASGDLSFLLVDDSQFLFKIKYQNKAWMLTNLNTNSTQLLDNQNHIINVDSNILGLSSYKITLKLDSAIAQGWTSAHNVSAEEYFYAIDPIEFYKPLDFILYPEYAWINNSPTLTFLNPSNYTLSFRPSAYGNKKNNTQSFWLSANKNSYISYIYTNTNNSYTSTLSSSFDIMDIAYDPQDISIYTGIPISLQCYNLTTYPISMGTTYYAPTAGALNLFTFNNYAITQDYNDNNELNFHLSPTIIPYNDLSLNHIIDTKIIDIDLSRSVTITQTLCTIPQNCPAVVVGGTVTYFLSSEFWTASSTVPALNGTYNIFNLSYGDPAIPLFTGLAGLDRYYLYATTNVIQQIPATTFPLGSADYTGNTDLWSQITL
jgi:hypothetical protein